jgi:hypothetical protein
MNSVLFFIALYAGLLQLVAHLTVELYAPHLGKLPRYGLGVLSLLVPPSVLVGWDAALPFWLCALFSGLAVVGANWLGAVIRKQQNDKAELERLRMISHAETEKER